MLNLEYLRNALHRKRDRVFTWLATHMHDHQQHRILLISKVCVFTLAKSRQDLHKLRSVSLQIFLLFRIDIPVQRRASLLGPNNQMDKGQSNKGGNGNQSSNRYVFC